MKRLLSIILVCMLLVMVGCEAKEPVIIVASDKTFEITSDYNVLSAGSGFVIPLQEENAVAMLLSAENADALKESAVKQNMIYEESDTHFIYDESSEDLSMFTYVSKVNDEVYYLISHSNLNLLRSVVKTLSIVEVEE